MGLGKKIAIKYFKHIIILRLRKKIFFETSIINMNKIFVLVSCENVKAFQINFLQILASILLIQFCCQMESIRLKINKIN